MNIYNLLTGEITQEELLNYHNATIEYEQMPEGVNGLVWLYKDIYIIFINENLSRYKKRKTILHELAHIELSQLGQIDKDLLVLRIDKYEDEVDHYIKTIQNKLKQQKKEMKSTENPNSSLVRQ